MINRVSLIGAPVWLGQTRYGTNLAPDALRAAGVIDILNHAGIDTIDEGNICTSSAGRFKQAERNVRNVKPIVQAAKTLAKHTSAVLEQGRFPLILGGDHSVAIGSIAGAANHCRNLGVLWFDAHADINTPETSPSGNIHGMPVASSLGLGHPALREVGGRIGKIVPEHIVYLGVRDLDPGEVAFIQNHGIRVYRPFDIVERGIDAVIAEALDYLTVNCDAIHLSFDYDGIDPIAAPGVGTPVEAGVSFADALRAVALLSASGQITSAEFVELNPILDRDGRTVQAALEVINAFVTSEAESLNYTARQATDAIGV